MNKHMNRLRADAPRHERGAALVFALAILLVLTLLSVSSLRTSSLEQLMAGNTQESTRAFEAAESGLAKSLADTSTFASISGQVTTNYSFSGMNATARVLTSFKQSTKPGRSANPTGQGTADVAHFDQEANATTTTGARTVLHQGVKKNIPKAN